VTCPYCQSRNADGALVCASCGRDVAVPATLLAERDDLLRKRDQLRHELNRARDEVETFIMRRRKRR
jgi:DNA-directed RNA polymerase subunit RPC12/RpoP